MSSVEALEDVLGRYSPRQPEEVVAIKRYVAEHFNSASSVAVQPQAIVITVQSASLANMLRLHLSQIQACCQTDKKLIFRIG